MLKVEVSAEREILNFDDLEAGDIFIIDSHQPCNPKMKINSLFDSDGCEVNAIYLCSGDVFYFEPSDKVILVKNEKLTYSY